MSDDAQRRVLLGIGLLLVALTVGAIALLALELWRPSAIHDDPGRAGVPANALVAEVRATDLLVLDSGEEVRLASLDVPAAGEPFAEEGRLAARALSQGSRVRVEGEVGDAYVYLPDGSLLQALLVSGGYARLDGEPDDEAVAAMLRAAQTEARDANLGIWAGAPAPTPQPTSAPIVCDPSLVPGDTLGPADAAANLDRVVNVVFLPLRTTSRNGNMTLLAGVGSSDFGATIPSQLATGAGETVLGYLNRCIVVTGRIERGTGEGPRITIRTFEDILILR